MFLINLYLIFPQNPDSCSYKKSCILNKGELRISNQQFYIRNYKFFIDKIKLYRLISQGDFGGFTISDEKKKFLDRIVFKSFRPLEHFGCIINSFVGKSIFEFREISIFALIDKPLVDDRGIIGAIQIIEPVLKNNAPQ